MVKEKFDNCSFGIFNEEKVDLKAMSYTRNIKADEEARKATEEAYKALEKTPEFKAYEKAWTWETLVKAQKALQAAIKALEATPEYKAYLESESEENKYEAEEAYRATPAYEAFVKATETFEEVRVAYYKA